MSTATQQLEITQLHPLSSVSLKSRSALEIVTAPVTQQLGIKPALTEMVSKAINQDNIRGMFAHNPGGAPESLAMELQFVAMSYCGSAKTDETVFDECMEFAEKQFGHLNLGEIREAFRLGAAGELGEVDLQSYYGLFTVATLGAILRAYDDYRKRIVAALRRAENEAYRAKLEAERMPHDSEVWMKNRLNQLIALPEPDLQNTTAYDHDFLEKQGWMLNDKETKEAAWVEAKAIATAQVAEEMQGNNPAIRAGLQAILRDVEAGKGNADFKSRRVGIAKRLLVCRWITQQRAQEIQ